MAIPKNIDPAVQSSAENTAALLKKDGATVDPANNNCESDDKRKGYKEGNKDDSITAGNKDDKKDNAL